MKYLLLLAALFAVSTASYKQSMLETNRVTEAEEEQVGFATSCDECQSVIHQIVEAAKDPKKLEELKLVLGLLCKETSYAEECRLFVSQLDRFIDKLAPYLKDARAICQRIHICGNPKINAFRRILLDYARRTDKVISGPQIVCDECEFAIKELKQALENKDWQVQVRDFLRNNICKTLGSYRGFCDLVVDEYLPQFIQQADAVLSDPHQVCIDIHACPSTSFTPARKYVFNKEELTKVEEEVETFWTGLNYKNEDGQVLAMSCFECKLLVDGTQEEMILNRKDIAGDIQNFACNNILPSNMTASCNNFMSMYLPTVVQMTIQQVTAKGVCMANKCCPNDSLSTYSKLSFNEIQTKKCEITKTLEQYVNANLAGSPVPKFFELKLLDMVCEAAFSFFKPMCQSLVEKIAPVLINVSVELAGKGAYHKALHC